SGHVHSHGRDRAHTLPKPRAVGLAVLPRLLQQPLAKGATTGVRRAQGVDLRGYEGIERGGELAGDVELAKRGGIGTIEATRVFQHGGVAARAHLGEDDAHALLHGAIVRAGDAQTLEGRGETGLRRREAARLHFAALAKASINGWSALRLVLSAAWLTMRRAEP